jgi:hypothetical protein
MKKIEEREKLLDDLAFNLNVSVNDVKEALKELTPVFDNEVQEKTEIAQTYAEKYVNKFFRDEDYEFDCNRFYVRITNVTYSPDFDLFIIKGECLTNLSLKIGANKFTYEPNHKKNVTLETLSKLELVDENVVHNYFAKEMEFFKRSCRNFLPQD